MELTSAAEAKKRRQKKQRNKERSAESAERQILKAKAKGERHKVKKHK
jgi:hypothetical protein